MAGSSRGTIRGLSPLPRPNCRPRTVMFLLLCVLRKAHGNRCCGLLGISDTPDLLTVSQEYNVMTSIHVHMNTGWSVTHCLSCACCSVGPRNELRLVKVSSTQVTPYAILLHIWDEDEDEVTFDDIGNGPDTSKARYAKLCFCINQAREDGLYYVWVDTCCT